MSAALVQDEAGVRTLLGEYVRAVEAGSFDAYAKVMARDVDVNFGAFGEPVRGWEGLERAIKGQFETLSAVTIDVTNLAVHVAGEGRTAWATSLWTFKARMGEQPISLPVRCTWILEKRAGAWVIVHWHKSTAAS